MKTSKQELGVRYLCYLRWAAILGEVAVFLLARYVFFLETAPGPFLIILAITVASNVLLGVLPRFIEPKPAIKSMILLDIVLLATNLYFYGGYTNPFTMLFLVYVTIAAFFLGSLWTWISLAVSGASFSLLFILVDASEQQHHAMQGTQFNLHLYGMLIAFLLVGSLIAFFITRMSSEIENLRARKFAKDKLEALASLAAGTAHELATPLGTILLIAEELSSHKNSNAPFSHFAADIDELHDQLLRAKEVLTRMRARSPELHAEVGQNTSVSEVLQSVLKRFSNEVRARVSCTIDSSAQTIRAYRVSLEEALHVMIKNALEESGTQKPVEVRISKGGSVTRFDVRDYGPGVAQENLSKLGEPFFTTKSVGQGMGLGLFLVKTFASHNGGEVFFRNHSPGFEVSLLVSEGK